MSVVVHPPKDAPWGFSFEDNTVTYWENGLAIADYNVENDEFYDRTYEMSDDKIEELIDEMITFYKTIG